MRGITTRYLCYQANSSNLNIFMYFGVFLKLRHMICVIKFGVLRELSIATVI